MEINYIDGRYLVSFQSDTESKSDSIYTSNYLFLQNLYKTNQSGDLETYKQLFEKFITDPNICVYFSYTDHPASNCDQVFYPLCECMIDEDSLIKIHKGLYEAKCSCTAGKRYIALRNAYEIALGKKCIMCTFQISDLIKENNFDETIFKSNPMNTYSDEFLSFLIQAFNETSGTIILLLPEENEK